jgi:hypothetical protein
MYLGGIPRLLDETGAFLSFLCVVTAIDILAGAWAPASGSGERFKGFVQAYFPVGLRERSEDLWRFRNLMIHAFNPGPFALVCHQSRLHLSPQGEVTILNAEDFYAGLLCASAVHRSTGQLTRGAIRLTFGSSDRGSITRKQTPATGRRAGRLRKLR